MHDTLFLVQPFILPSSAENQIQMKQFFTMLFLLSLVYTGLSQNHFACGVETGEWNYDTVFVQCDVQIPDGQTLQIAPGTRVVFTGYYSLLVQGTLKALGQSADSIAFTVADTTGFGNMHSTEGGWNGIRIEDVSENNDSTQFAFCRFSYGKAAGDSANCYGGAVRIKRFNKISFRHSSFRNNYSFLSGGAVYAFKSNLIIENCVVADNDAGNDGMVYGYGGGLCFVSSDPVVRKNLFYANSSTGVGGAASFEFSRPVMLDCIIRNNYSALGGGLCFLRSQPDKQVANLLIINNEAKFFGGGIANLTATTVMSNATITGNLAPMGGGYYCNEYAHAKLHNSILWGNIAYDTLGSQVWIWDVNSMPGFYHTIVEGGIPWFGGSTFQGDFVNCPDLDPLFNQPELGDYSLAAASPAINTANKDFGIFELPVSDLAGHNRLMYGQLDMGAYEYQGFVDLKSVSENETKLDLYPIPVTENSVLAVSSPADASCTLRISNGSGKVIVVTEIVMKQGRNQWNLNNIITGKQLTKGIYLLEIKGQNTWLKLKFVV